MRATVREWWPALADLAFTHAWGGYLGVPRDWTPVAAFDAETRIGRLGGYTGRGVSTSAMAAKLLAGLIGGWTTGLEGLPFRRDAGPAWEAEPLRWTGVRYVQNALQRLDAAEFADRAAPADAPVARWLGEQ